jgi:hypothetical protein
MSIHQGAVSLDHLDAYLGELIFLCNRPESRTCGKFVFRLLEQSVVIQAASYKYFVKCGADLDFLKSQNVVFTGVRKIHI